MISCADAVRRLWEYLDGTIEESDRALIEEHLGVCLRCCGAAEFAKMLADFLASKGSEDLPDEVRARLVSSIEEIAR